jgi:hypothetical protein
LPIAIAMSDTDLLLAVERGSILAPAGCGKTELIALTLKCYTDGKPTLVLTHTNAGKAALEQRLECCKVPRHAYRVFTIDSWAIRLATRFPERCGASRASVMVENPSSDYPAVRSAVAAMLIAGHLDDALKSTYSRVLVDEYQDCSLAQHAIVVAVAKTLPTLVFGDPLQAIFTFSGPTVGWNNHVRAEFPQVLNMRKPWRWDNVGTGDLGRWLISIRRVLWEGNAINLQTAPPEVRWVKLEGDRNAIHRQRMQTAMHRAPNNGGSVLVIGQSVRRENRHEIASCCPGAVVVEPVDLPDLTMFGRTFKPGDVAATQQLIDFATEMMTGVSKSALIERLAVLRRGRQVKVASAVEAAVLAIGPEGTHGAAAAALQALAASSDTRVYRPDIFRMCVAALASAHAGSSTLHDAVVRERERARHLGRRLALRAVGSTLLLKGLEADVSIVLYPEEMNGRHLYVALTRGSRQVVICSSSPVLQPVAWG